MCVCIFIYIHICIYAYTPPSLHISPHPTPPHNPPPTPNTSPPPKIFSLLHTSHPPPFFLLHRHLIHHLEIVAILLFCFLYPLPSLIAPHRCPSRKSPLGRGREISFSKGPWLGGLIVWDVLWELRGSVWRGCQNYYYFYVAGRGRVVVLEKGTRSAVVEVPYIGSSFLSISLWLSL